MIVPTYWAEARATHRQGRKQITLRRVGWSDTSEADAQRMAEERVREALARVAAGEKLPRIDYKRAYNGAQGLPIREEVLERRGEDVITRNVYGARCLNTPDVLFADIDFAPAPETLSTRMTLVLTVALIAVLAAAVATRLISLAAATGAAMAVWIGVAVVVAAVNRWRGAARVQAWRGAQHGQAMARVREFTRTHPAWQLRVYETPAGLRVLAMHRLFDPGEDDVARFFRALGVDKVYQAMCRNQHCFRARLSAKPWRIGIAQRIGPRPGVWPVRDQWLDRRRAWVRAYEDRARGYAACRFLETIGTAPAHPRARDVQALHDVECRAESTLPLA